MASTLVCARGISSTGADPTPGSQPVVALEPLLRRGDFEIGESPTPDARTNAEATRRLVAATGNHIAPSDV